MQTLINSTDPLLALIQQSRVLASAAAVLLLMCCALLVAFRHQQRPLIAMQARLDSLSSDISQIRSCSRGHARSFHESAEVAKE
jgi:hypothetical protein